ncbi:Short-chain dehydrogenase/reductase tropE [Cladobotryum mycophilum]|uniref:Short-chain dehydrogenase/reductase tropE n=1 Tax=Cladobotryum mycophilum TaxID=491253 RepID=A0ABR0S4X3_9HYPO
MSDKEIVFITGANKGIGYETVKALFQSPKSYHVFLGTRSVANGDAAVAQLSKEVPRTSSTVEVVQIDIEDDESITRAAELVKGKTGRIDVLVNNAGAAFDTTFVNDASRWRTLFNQSFNVNVTGTQVFMPSWSGGVAGGWPKDDNFTAIQAYKTVKTGLNMLMLTWYQILKADGVKTWAISPGFLATDLGEKKEMLKKVGAGDPSIGGS